MTRPRAREMGIWFGELPTGPRNMITDVPGVAVGHSTIIKGSGKLVPGSGPVRTGVTAILPHKDNLYQRTVPGACFDMNGCGGLLGSVQIREFGMIDTPIMLTNTMNMGSVAEGTIRHMMKQNPSVGIDTDTIIPIVSECDDSYLNDSQGLHVRDEHVFEALDRAGPVVEEGAVGAGTGMSCYDFKGGIGTSSRLVTTETGDKYHVGTLVLTNHGDKDELRIDGVPVGHLLGQPSIGRPEQGSIVMIVGTDAPVNSRQLERLARRAIMGLAVTGSCSHNGSGDLVISFSTANVHERFHTGPFTDKILPDRSLDAFFRATIDSIAESITNSLFKAQTMEGRDGHVVPALPIEETLDIMKRHGRLIRGR